MGTKVSALTATTTYAATDIFAVVINPGTSPESRKMTFDDLFTEIVSNFVIKTVNGIDIGTSDVDIDLVTVGVTGTPKLWWDESEDSFALTKGLLIGSLNGVDCNPGSDVDADLITVGVTGTPKLWWDESEDSFSLTKGLQISGLNGVDCNPGSDVDADLITVGVTGAPKLWWDESEDSFVLTKGLHISGLNGVDCKPGSDVDTDLITVGVTGTPRLWWDEPADVFTFNKSVTITGITSIYAPYSENILGSELVTNWDFVDITTGWTAGANWSYSGGDALHTAGSQATLVSASVGVASGSRYRLQVVVGQYSAGTCAIALTNSSGMTFADFGTAGCTVYFKASGAGTVITITPSSDFAGSIVSVSIKVVTQNAAGALNLYNTDGVLSAFRVKAGGSGLTNIFIGGNVGDYNLVGIKNVIIGDGAFSNNVSGNYNIGLGTYVLLNNISGVQNIGFGYGVLYSNLEGTFNIGIGYQSLYNITLGGWNVAIGRDTLYSHTTGTYNVAIGHTAAQNITSGNFNICLGPFAGRYQADGATGLTGAASCIYIGHTAMGYNNSDVNSIVIGASAKGIGPNTTVIGADATHLLTQLGGAIQLTNTAAAPTNGANKAHLYCADQTAGNACIFTKTEGGAVIKLYQQAHIANATGGTEITTINAILTALENNGLLASA